MPAILVTLAAPPMQRRTSGKDLMPLKCVDWLTAHAHQPTLAPLAPRNALRRVEVVSAAFEGKGAVQRHRLVYSLLQPEIDAGVHALALKTKTPAEQLAAAGAATQQGE